MLVDLDVLETWLAAAADETRGYGRYLGDENESPTDSLHRLPRILRQERARHGIPVEGDMNADSPTLDRIATHARHLTGAAWPAVRPDDWGGHARTQAAHVLLTAAQQGIYWRHGGRERLVAHMERHGTPFDEDFRQQDENTGRHYFGWDKTPKDWPYPPELWAPSADPIDNLVTAAALIVNEIDRLTGPAGDNTGDDQAGMWDRWVAAIAAWLKERPSMADEIPVDELADLCTVNRRWNFLTDIEEQILAAVPEQVREAVESDNPTIRAALLAAVIAGHVPAGDARHQLAIEIVGGRFVVTVTRKDGH